MSYGFLDIARTPSVKAAEAANGSAQYFDDFKGDRAFDKFGPAEAQFIAARDSFYMATVSETGWPYVQHRGGPPGFLRVIDEKTLAFLDFRGNRQYISLGNASAGFPAASSAVPRSTNAIAFPGDNSTALVKSATAACGWPTRVSAWPRLR